MKKLLLFTMLGLFTLTAEAQVPVATAPASWCCGTDLTVSGSWYKQFKSQPAPIYYVWELWHCDQNGVLINPNPLVFSSGTLAGGPNGNYVFTNTANYTTCGEYYLVQLNITPNGGNWYVATQIVQCLATPQPAITGSASCGFGNYSATPTGAGYSYQWSASYNSAPYNSLFPNGSNCGVGTGNFNAVKVIVTDANGCVGQTTQSVTNTNPNIDADFTLTCTSYGPNDPYFYVTITRSGSYSLTGVTSEVIQVQDINTNVQMSYNTCWTSSANTWSAPIRLFGYDGPNFFTYTNNCSASIPGYQYGRMDKNHSYRIEHYIWVNGCMKWISHAFNYTNGIYCTNCREGQPATEENETLATTVYPNPNNGAFTVQLNESAENAQAELINLLGERVDAFTFSGTSFSYSPAQTLAPGVYLLRVTTNGVANTQRIVIE